MTEKTFQVYPVGYVRRDGGKTRLEILTSYVSALKQMEHLSHVHVFWWFSEFQDDEHRAMTQVQPPYENAPVSGVFALRAPTRPNPIGLTAAEVLSVDHKRGVVEIVGIDAFDGTPILDIKPHIPVDDRVKDARTPEWMAGWPEWMPEEGHGLAEDRPVSTQSDTHAFELFPVGHIRRGDGKAVLRIREEYVPALKNLEDFSHVRILWWFHRLDGDRFRRATHNKPPYENAPVTGVFASRSPVRPNPIGLTTAQILGVDHARGIVEIAGTDMFDETPVVDLKPYIPASDRVKHFRVPEWIAHWPAWHQGLEGAEVVSASSLRPPPLSLRDIPPARRGE